MGASATHNFPISLLKRKKVCFPGQHDDDYDGATRRVLASNQDKAVGEMAPRPFVSPQKKNSSFSTGPLLLLRRRRVPRALLLPFDGRGTFVTCFSSFAEYFAKR